MLISCLPRRKIICGFSPPCAGDIWTAGSASALGATADVQAPTCVPDLRGQFRAFLKRPLRVKGCEEGRGDRLAEEGCARKGDAGFGRRHGLRLAQLAARVRCGREKVRGQPLT
jgi:hypothetical protein